MNKSQKDYVDDIVEYWHTHDLNISMESYVSMSMDWTPTQYDIWVRTGDLPDGS